KIPRRATSKLGGPSGKNQPIWWLRPMIRLAALVGVTALLVPTLAAGVAAPHVDVSLVAEHASVQPGHDRSVGLRFATEKGWHVYWRNPGDSGEAPRLTWRLPDGFRATDLGWPAPMRIATGPLANFGYEGTTLLPATVHVPRELPSTVELRAD